MPFIADLHIHSHFSRATSQDLVPEDLSLWAQKKGITLIGTGDFTHPGWVKELKEKLVDAENGLYQLRPDLSKVVEKQVTPSCKALPRFILTSEISCIYKRGGKTRKIHHLVLMPDFESVEDLNARLRRIGNIASDGRPILGLDSRDLLEIVVEASDRSLLIPAHIWTPWFSLFGSQSGFDTIEECFGDLTSHIHTLETGLSSDPPMNRTLSALDDYVLVSNSDAHSSSKLGREANIFSTPLDYDEIVRAMTDKAGFEGTIEFFPEEGKYHFDGHRKCEVCFHPSETKRCKGICPKCGKPLTVGVLHRVYELSDRKEPERSTPFHSLIPLPEILSEILGCGASSKKVLSLYDDLLTAHGPELRILMDVPLEEIEKAGGPLLGEAIDRMRRNRVIRQEGYDGAYGVIRLFDEAERDDLRGQATLFAFPKKPRAEKRKPAYEKDQALRSTKDSSLQQAHASHTLLAPLNRAQREAVLHQGGHLLIVAGPGTGKTLTLTHRIAHQIQAAEVAPDQILALTFTNKAAKELKTRLSSLLSENLSSRIWVSTFHAFCLDLLRKEAEKAHLPAQFTLCPETDASILADSVLSEIRTGRRRIQGFPRKLPRLKMASVLGGKEDQSFKDFLPLYEEYQKRLRRLGMIDLDDLEVETLRLFQGHPQVATAYGRRFPYIFLDEYQDTNRIQVEILKAIASCGTYLPCAVDRGPCPVSICAIGDPDQAIYGFRSADVKSFHRFEEDFPGAKKIVLFRNYRSTQNILDSAATLLNKDVALESSLPEGDPIRFASCRTDGEEAEMIVEQIEKLIGGTSYFSVDSGRVSSHENGRDLSFGDIAVLFRLNAQGDAFEKALSRAGIPFIRSGEKALIEGFPINVIWRFLQTLAHPEKGYYSETYLSLLRKCNLTPSPRMKCTSSPLAGEERGEGGVGGEQTLLELIDHAVALHGLGSLSEEEGNRLCRLKDVAMRDRGDLNSFLDALSLERGIDHTGLLGDRVALMSLHAAKGLEWPVVFIAGCEDGLIPCSLFGDRDDEEEKRLFYVGMTRARSRLFLSSVNRRTIRGRSLEMKPSPFISLIPEDLCKPLEREAWKPKKKPQDQLQLF